MHSLPGTLFFRERWTRNACGSKTLLKKCTFRAGQSKESHRVNKKIRDFSSHSLGSSNSFLAFLVQDSGCVQRYKCCITGMESVTVKLGVLKLHSNLARYTAKCGKPEGGE